MRLSKKMLPVTLCCVNLSLLLTAAGCSPPGRPTASGVIQPATSETIQTMTIDETSQRPVVTTTMKNLEPLPDATPTTSESDRWLTIGSLQNYLADLQSAAARQGCAAAWCQPDPQSGQSFLAVAAGQLTAEQLNGYFFWLLDPQASAGEPELLLCIDRLFSDETRQASLASGSYSEPRARFLLDFSLQQILAGRYEPAVSEFVLTCYRTAFQNRMNAQEPAAQTWSQAFELIEVTYEAAIANTVSFRTIRPAAPVA